MNERDFIFWLQGFMEVADPKSIDEKQIQIIKDHIALVLKKETPNRNGTELVISQGPLMPVIAPRSCPNGAGLGGNCGKLSCPYCSVKLSTVAVC